MNAAEVKPDQKVFNVNQQNVDRNAPNRQNGQSGQNPQNRAEQQAEPKF